MDKRRQELEELHDDIHLALLMDEYANSMGAQVRVEAEEAFTSGELAIPREADDACRSILAQTTRTENRKKSSRSLARYLAVAAATIVVLFGTLVVVQASGIDVFGKLASWTDSVFHYNSNSKAKDSQGEESGPYKEIEAALRELGLPVEFAPSRLPEGFSVTSLQKAETTEMRLHNPHSNTLRMGGPSISLKMSSAGLVRGQMVDTLSRYLDLNPFTT